MALTKQPVNINFGKGLDRKTDPYQIPIGNFLALNNMTFNTPDRLTKRDGFGSLSSNPNNTPLNISTYNDALLAIGNNIQSYTENASPNWVNMSTAYKPVELQTVSLIRNSLNQTQSDSAVASNGSVCVTYTQTQDYITYTYNYSVLDVNTGAKLIAVTDIAAATEQPKVFALGNYFIIVYGTASALYYISININTLSVAAPVQITSSYTPSSYCAFDGVVASSALYLAWNGGSSSGIKMAYLNSSLVLSSVINPDSSHTAQVVAVTADTSGATPVIWVLYQGSAGSGYVLAENSTLGSLLLSATAFTATNILNLTAYATAGVCTAFLSQPDIQAYDTSIILQIINAVTITQAGSVGTEYIVARQCGIAAKPFVLNSVVCLPAVFSTPYQPTYFLLDATTPTSNPLPVLARFAYQNGGPYLSSGLGNVTSYNSTYYFSYSFKDLIAPVNKQTGGSSTATNPISPGGIYAQLGVNLVGFSYPDYVQAVEAGRNSNISTGYLFSYDGVSGSENNFFIWPEFLLNIDGTYHGVGTTTATFSPTCTTTSGSYVLTSVSSTSGIGLGQTASGTGIASGSKVVAVGSGTIRLSLPMTSSGSGRTITFTGNVGVGTYYYVFTYEFADNQGNIFRSAPSVPVSVAVASGSSTNGVYVPYLPLTNKTITSVKLVGYRWSLAQQTYFQFTSIIYPTLNATSADSIQVVDGQSDSAIIGNNILYTTGGVAEDICPPAPYAMTLFDDRLWMIDSENRNVLWYSKQIIDATPIEMSDLFTLYIAPTLGGQGSTGPMTALGYLDDKLIIFKGQGNAMYYINGSGPDNTGANNQYSQPVFITSPVGCSNQRSITLMPKGLMFQAADDKGIWLLDRGLQVTYIGAPVEAYNSYTVTSALTMPDANQVRLTLSDGTTLVYDYFVDQWSTFTGITVKTACIYESLHTLLSTSNAAYQQTPGTYSDGATPVTFSFTTGWINIAGLRGYERAYFFFLLGTYLSAHTLTFQIAYDYDDTIEQTSTFTPSDLTANDIEQIRVFLSRQRCRAFKLTVTESVNSAGAGLTISGLNMILGFKKAFAPIAAAKSVGES